MSIEIEVRITQPNQFVKTWKSIGYAEPESFCETVTGTDIRKVAQEALDQALASAGVFDETPGEKIRKESARALAGPLSQAPALREYATQLTKSGTGLRSITGTYGINDARDEERRMIGNNILRIMGEA